MAGIIQDQDYFNRRIAPAIDGKRVAYLGPVGGSARARTLGKARALLHLINFDEPFGLSVVEAMACGTPVIAFKRGSMPELIEHRVTGFLDEAVEAIGRIGEINRASCRAAVMARFTVDRMADLYVSLYRSLLEKA
jgi:glycosyltransferase involved in cell wall biosynthesis